VIVEPIAGNMNLVRATPEFLRAMRELTAHHGALLIFDEVMSGFRVALGGAQALYGHRAGSHGAGQGDRRRLAGGRLRRQARGDEASRAAGAGLSGRHAVRQSGGRGLRAGHAEADPAAGFLYGAFAPHAAAVDGLVGAAREAAPGLPFCADAVGGMFGIYFAAGVPATYEAVMRTDKERFNRFFHAMLERGVYLAPSAFEAGFVSIAHDNAVIDATLEAAREAFRTIR
jgi:glutamate-1-semialdehyde 2,1-aminomutase